MTTSKSDVYHLLPLIDVHIKIRIKLSVSEHLRKPFKLLVRPTHFMFQFTTCYQKVHSSKLNKIFNTTSLCLSNSWICLWNAASNFTARDKS